MFRQDLQTSPAMRPLSAPIGHLSKNVDVAQTDRPTAEKIPSNRPIKNISFFDHIISSRGGEFKL